MRVKLSNTRDSGLDGYEKLTSLKQISPVSEEADLPSVHELSISYFGRLVANVEQDTLFEEALVLVVSSMSFSNFRPITLIAGEQAILAFEKASIANDTCGIPAAPRVIPINAPT